MGSLASNQVVEVIFFVVNFFNGSYIFIVFISLFNGGVDDEFVNNEVIFSFLMGDNILMFLIILDNFLVEIIWSIIDDSNNVLVLGGSYSNQFFYIMVNE